MFELIIVFFILYLLFHAGSCAMYWGSGARKADDMFRMDREERIAEYSRLRAQLDSTPMTTTEYTQESVCSERPVKRKKRKRRKKSRRALQPPIDV